MLKTKTAKLPATLRIEMYERSQKAPPRGSEQLDRLVASGSIRMISSCRSPVSYRQGTVWLITQRLHGSIRKTAARKTGCDNTGDMISLKLSIKLEDRSCSWSDLAVQFCMMFVRGTLCSSVLTTHYSSGEQGSMSTPLLAADQHLWARRRYNAGCGDG